MSPKKTSKHRQVHTKKRVRQVNHLKKLPEEPLFKVLVGIGMVGVIGVVAFLIYAGAGKLLFGLIGVFGVVIAPFLLSREVREAIKGISAFAVMLIGIGVLVILALAIFLGAALILR